MRTIYLLPFLLVGCGTLKPAIVEPEPILAIQPVDLAEEMTTAGGPMGPPMRDPVMAMAPAPAPVEKSKVVEETTVVETFNGAGVITSRKTVTVKKIEEVVSVADTKVVSVADTKEPESFTEKVAEKAKPVASLAETLTKIVVFISGAIGLGIAIRKLKSGEIDAVTT